MWPTSSSHPIIIDQNIPQDNYRISRFLGLEERGLDAGGGYHIHDSSPAAVHVAVARRRQDLVQLKFQLFGRHLRLEVCLADGHQLLARGSRHFESLDHALCSDGIVAGQDCLPVLKAGDDRLHEVVAEAE